MERELAILMADLTGYTAMTDVHGGASAANLIKRYLEIVKLACIGTTELVERVGDQVVMIADNAEDLVGTINSIHLQVREEHLFLQLHAGMHYGPVLIQDHQLFGTTVNVTARIMNFAKRGQIVCSSSFVSNMPMHVHHHFLPLATHRLKNVLDEIGLFELTPAMPKSLLRVDPVCQMHLDLNRDFLLHEHNGITYHFCSERCLTLFRSSPSRFT